MNKAKENQLKVFDYEILFKDSPSYFVVNSSKMLTEGGFVRFITFLDGVFVSEEFYPIANIHRIKRYN